MAARRDVEPAAEQRRHASAAREPGGVDAGLVDARARGDVVDHVARVGDVVGAAGLHGHVPPRPFRVERRDEEGFRGGHGLESAGARLTGGVAAAAVQIEHQRQAPPPVIARRHEQAVGALPPSR